MDENKTYSIIGKVEIGTDEYRDLITERFRAEKDADTYRSKYWEESSKTNKLEKEIAELKKRIDMYEGFLADADDKTAFEIYVVRQQRGE